MKLKIFENFKVFYRQEIVNGILLNIEKGTSKSIDSLKAIWFCHKAWDKVTWSTIFNCFRSCGFRKNQIITINNTEEPVSIDENWNQVTSNVNVIFSEYARVLDENVIVCGQMSDDDIADSVTCTNDDNDNNNTSDCENDAKESEIIDGKQAKNILDDLRCFVESFLNVPDDIFRALDKINNFVDKNFDLIAKKQQY